jgi:ABC-type Zn uptake system ZnuABC Zn-binding protein ZnuA
MRPVALLALLATIVLGCGPAPLDGRPLVLTTTTLLADMARNVGGDRVRVESMVPAGAHVEEYEPKPADARHVAQARLIVENGLDLDAWAERLLGDRRADASVLVVSDGLPTIDDNPHLWFDVQLARRYVEKIRDALIALDAEGRDGYQERFARYDAALVALDAEVKDIIATIPAERRKLVTSHDAFRYLAQAYGLEIVGFAQIEPGKDPRPAELAALVGAVRASGVSAIFSESGSSPIIAEAVAQEVGPSVRVVTDLPTDGVLAAPADTYIGVVRTVATTIADALR